MYKMSTVIGWVSNYVRGSGKLETERVRKKIRELVNVIYVLISGTGCEN